MFYKAFGFEISMPCLFWHALFLSCCGFEMLCFSIIWVRHAVFGYFHVCFFVIMCFIIPRFYLSDANSEFKKLKKGYHAREFFLNPLPFLALESDTKMVKFDRLFHICFSNRPTRK